MSINKIFSAKSSFLFLISNIKAVLLLTILTFGFCSNIFFANLYSPFSIADIKAVLPVEFIISIFGFCSNISSANLYCSFLIADIKALLLCLITISRFELFSNIFSAKLYCLI